MDKKYLMVKEAAKELKLAEQTVRDYISSGKIKSEKIYNSTVISQEEIERYIEEVRNDKI